MPRQGLFRFTRIMFDMPVSLIEASVSKFPSPVSSSKAITSDWPPRGAAMARIDSHVSGQCKQLSQLWLIFSWSLNVWSGI